MKKTVLLFCFIIFSITILKAQNDAKLWETLYKNTKYLKEKRDITKKIYDIVTNEFEDLILLMLYDEATYPNLTSTLDKKIFEDWVSLTVLMHQKLNIKKGTEDLKKLYKLISNPINRGDIVYAIGKITEPSSLPWLNNELKKYNDLQREARFPNGEEKILMGLINALDFYKDKSSFYDLFYVSIPNYPAEIRKMAQESLKKITNDPAPIFNEWFNKEQNAHVMIESLNYTFNSASPNEKKIETCKIALQQLLSRGFDRDNEETVRVRTRNLATQYLGELKATSPEVLDLIAKEWDQDVETTSRIVVIEALQKIATEDAAKFLADKLDYFTMMKQEGSSTYLTIKDEAAIIIALVQALGEIPNKIGLQELFNVTTVFADPIISKAERAFQKKRALK